MTGVPVGLCAGCRHARRVETGRGSTFYLCGRSQHDPRYPKYPRLPMLDCAGFERQLNPGDSTATPE
ncbi:MAG: hypothetical protein K1X74_08230 [Pirellulales bacterium]|nr:hypothetical protein [Pirellulales bacterium]